MTQQLEKVKRQKTPKDLLLHTQKIEKRKTPDQCVCTGQGVISRIITQTQLTPSRFQDISAIATRTWIITEEDRNPPEGWGKD
jgi:hypothetical protein